MGRAASDESKRKLSPFAERLKQLREQAGLTQAQLAEKAGMHPMSLAKLEQGGANPSGRGQSPTWETVEKLANALGISCEQFRMHPPKPKKK